MGGSAVALAFAVFCLPSFLPSFRFRRKRKLTMITTPRRTASVAKTAMPSATSIASPTVKVRGSEDHSPNSVSSDNVAPRSATAALSFAAIEVAIGEESARTAAAAQE